MNRYRVRELDWGEDRVWIVLAPTSKEALEMVMAHEEWKGHGLAYSTLDYHVKREKVARIVKFITKY